MFGKEATACLLLLLWGGGGGGFLQFYFIVPYGKSGSPYADKIALPLTVDARAALPIPVSVCGISVYQTMVWLPVFGICNVRTAVDACNCTRGLYGHRKRVCTGS